MIDLRDKGLLLFDGDCGVCSKLAEWAARRDGGRHFRVEPYFEFSEEQLAHYGLTWADCTRAVQLITSQGKVIEGAFAVNRFLWTLAPFKPLVATLYLLFPLLGVEMLGYAIVAKNRHRISAALGMNECKVRLAEGSEMGPSADPH
jgi:predicted DCC family thiol-disulfide oxidoreductase YuxK